VRVVYSDTYEIDIGPHVWPTAKYRKIRDRLLSGPDAARFQLTEARTATWEQLALVHTPEYLRKLRDLSLSPEEVIRLEVPWNGRIRDGFVQMAGGSIDTARYALTDGVALHLGGGLHHAFPAHGEGFCPVNDVAIAVRVLQQEGAIARAAIVDCDVHQGNGTAAVFQGDPSVYTFSIHQEHNYPSWKPPGNLDIGLRDRTTDGEYLERLHEGLEGALESHPELVVYLAGADPYVEDQLGGLALSKEGLRRRDRAVIEAARHAGVPVAIVLAGGYARRVEDTVDIHAATATEAGKINEARM
jgi:acetoin utilization deacetylase AcuC-like enzyme